MKDVAMKLSHVVFAAVAILGTAVAYAEEIVAENNRVIYVGAGAAKSASATVNGSTPMSLGFLTKVSDSSFVWGFDIGAEGTMLDSTWGQSQLAVQATSYNLLLGKNIRQNENSSFNLALLVGMRETTADCPSSYLGYQCYANATPTTNYGFNYGGVVTWSYKNLVLGVRATAVSTQALLGFSF